MQPIEDDNELGHPLVRKETVTHLPESEEEEKEKKVQATVAVIEPGHPLIRKETVSHLTEDKGGVADLILTTPAGIHNEPGHPLEHKDILTHLPDKKGEKDRKKDRRDEADSVQLTAAAIIDNEPGHPLECKVTVAHLPEKDKKDVLHSVQQPRVLGLAISPGCQTAVNKSVGVIDGRGLIGRVTDGDDTEEDATAFTNTESEVRK